MVSRHHLDPVCRHICRYAHTPPTIGPVTKIAPDWVVCSDPTEIRRIWSVRSGWYRSPWYKNFRLDPNRDNILTMTENKDHHRLRAHLLAGYAGKGIHNQEQLVDEQILRYIQLIERKYISAPGDPRPMDMSRTTQYLTQDLTSSVAFGKAFGYLDADDDIFGVIEVSEALLAPLAITALFPIFLAITKSPFMKPFLPKPTDKHGVGRMLGIIKSHVDTRYGASKTCNTDVLQSFVESGLPRDEVEAESLIQLVGGTDSTATAIRNIIFFVSTNPTAYKRLQEEIDSAGTSDRVIPDRQAKSLPYLQAVIREGLRMWPPISGLMPRMSDQDEVICGVRVPAKTNVAWAVSGIMKDKASFGPDADSFDPDRWINAEPARLKAMEAAQGLVFMSGSRWECLGKRLAYVELGKVIFEVYILDSFLSLLDLTMLLTSTQLFRRFDFAMSDPARPFRWENYGLTIQHEMNVKITKRNLAAT